MLEVNKTGWMEKEKPVAGPLDAIIRPIVVAPCSSDTHAMHGGAGPMTERTLGHEAVGKVVEVGSLVKKFKPGDIVVVPCCTPDWTEVGMQEKNINSAHDAGMMGSFKFLLQKDGVFAEYFSVNCADANLVLLPEGVSLESALMTTDMMSTGFYGAEMANVRVGDTVVVFGIGPVGLMAVAGAKAMGAARIIGVGTRPNCVVLAKEYGATDIVSYKEGDVVEQILKIAGGKVDGAVIAGGNSQTMNQALAVVKNNGAIGNVNFFDATAKFEIAAPEWALGMGDITIRGGFCPGGAYRIGKLLKYIQAGRIDPSKVFNYKYEGFEKIEEAFKVMDEKPRDLIKPIVYVNLD